MASLPAPLRSDHNPDSLREQEMSEVWHNLTPLQQAWVLEFLTNGRNATQAAKDAGYQCSSDSAFRRVGWKNRHNGKITCLLERTMEKHMSEAEALSRLADVARADLGDFLTPDEQGEMVVDLEKARDLGVLHVAKSVEIDTEKGKVKVKLYDKTKALRLILKAHNAFDNDDSDDQSVTVNQWITQINQHMEGSEESPWPQLDE